MKSVAEYEGRGSSWGEPPMNPSHNPALETFTWTPHVAVSLSLSRGGRQHGDDISSGALQEVLAAIARVQTVFPIH